MPCLRLSLLALPLCACGGIAFKMGTRSDAPARTAPPPEQAAVEQAMAEHAGRPRTGKSEEAAIASALRYVESQQHSYKLSPADLIEVSVYQESDLGRKVRVSPDGIVSLPLIGRVKVGGLGVPEAEDAIRDQLKRFLINPQVTIFVAEYGNRQVYVLGEVAHPGTVDLPTEAPLSVIEAVTLAGGFTPYASQDRTRVIRRAKSGPSEVHVIEVSAITRRGDKSKDMTLQPNDVVFIPESFF